jgi:4'-phosphopantetheinyl transferase
VGVIEGVIEGVNERGISARDFVLGETDLHVWEAWLDQPSSEVQRLRGLLAPDEVARADRFHFERDRARYTVGRGLLRTLLGGYLDTSPRAVTFSYGANEKPFVAGARGPWFNLSHSGAVALYAFSAQAEVGIDVELDDPSFASERIAERFFSPAEVAVLRGLPAEQQGQAFLVCWTRKEAFIKARGDGLTLPLDSFDVTLDNGSPAALLRTAWSRAEPGSWLLRDISDRERGYVAAIAIRSRGCCVIRRQVGQTFDDDRDIQEEQS